VRLKDWRDFTFSVTIATVSLKAYRWFVVDMLQLSLEIEVSGTLACHTWDIFSVRPRDVVWWDNSWRWVLKNWINMPITSFVSTSDLLGDFIEFGTLVKYELANYDSANFPAVKIRLNEMRICMRAWSWSPNASFQIFRLAYIEGGCICELVMYKSNVHCCSSCISILSF